MQGISATVIYMVVFFGIMYFLMIRPQQQQAKKKTQMLSQLKLEDKVITMGGLVGRVVRFKEQSVILRVADKVEIEVLRSAIQMVTARDD